jgi:DNA primase
MSGRIPPQFIDDLLSRTDIVQIIGDRVPLKKAGHEFQARCPFHDEKTPSFYVSPSKQFYHCFGCGAHGTAIGFLMEYDRLEFPAAVEELARRAGLEVPRDGVAVPTGPDHAPLYRILEQAAAFYQRQLRHHPSAPQAVAYLKGRGLSGAIAAEFAIGYAPPGWDHLLRELGGNARDLESLRLAGLLAEGDGKRYDRFRNRILFPIRDRRGRVIAFGGRVLGDDKPKYLNSPETPLFHKGRELYGLFEAVRSVRKLERLLVVEGYMDVVALAQFDIRNVVATLGTATTGEHLEQLFRVVGEVVFCFDGDRAGRDAAWKALNNALPQMRDGRSVRFLFLPEGEDPDTLVRKEGAAAFTQRLQGAPALSQVLFQQLEQQCDTATPDGRARLAELARPLLSRLPEGVFRELLQGELSQRVGTQVRLPSAPPTPPRPLPTRRPRLAGRAAGISPMQRALILLLRHPQLASLDGLPDGWREGAIPGATLLTEVLELARRQPETTAAQLVERYREGPHHRHLSRLAAMDLEVPPEGEEAEFRGTLQRLTALALDEETRMLLEQSRSGALAAADKERLRRLLGEARKAP